VYFAGVSGSSTVSAAAPITIRADASRISVTHPIAPGDRLSSIMLRYGVDPLSIGGCYAAGLVADLGRIEAGHTPAFTFTANQRLVSVSYDRGDDGRVIVEDTGKALHARVEEPAVVVTVVGVRGTLESGFYRDARRAGVPDAVISRMVDLLSREIDFRTGVRRGDRFRLLYEQRRRRDGGCCRLDAFSPPTCRTGKLGSGVLYGEQEGIWCTSIITASRSSSHFSVTLSSSRGSALTFRRGASIRS
jgi:hypothetical protein